MRDYAEQVKALRYCGDCDRQGCAKECKYGKEHPLNFRCIGFLFADAADAIEELLAKVPTWISVEERLPEENKQIISYLAYKGMSVLQYENKHFYMQGAFQPLPKEAVTHWMPLPAPPKGGNHDN